jgi:chemotaxis protein methyltransferase CheR
VPFAHASPQVLAILSTLIEEKTGMHYAPSDFDILRDKITPKAEERGCDSLLDYYYLLRYDDPSGREMDELIDVLVVPETYFFREFDAIKLMASGFVEPLVAAGVRPRIWCAASATGEEPLTLAMVLDDRGVLDREEIVASDMSARVLGRAKAGEFASLSVRHVHVPELAARYLDTSGRIPRIKPELLAAIRWERVNLVVEPQVTELGAFDVVLCRNVLIYFKDETALRVIATIRKVLRPGGVLFVGASESLLRLGTLFVCEERAGSFFYRPAP